MTDESLALFGSTLAKLDNDHFAVVQQLEPFFEGIIKSYMTDEEVKAAGVCLMGHVGTCAYVSLSLSLPLSLASSHSLLTSLLNISTLDLSS